MTTHRLAIEGMSCDHCIRAVRSALDSLPGVTPVDVQIGSAAIDFDGTRQTLVSVARAIEEAGYHLTHPTVKEQ